MSQRETNFVKKLNLAEFSKEYIIGGTTQAFRESAIAKNPSFVVQVNDLLLPFKKLSKAWVDKHIVCTQCFDEFDKTNIDLFCEYASTENDGPFAFLQALFLPAIQMLGDDKQVEYWTAQAMAHRITASYMQTEMTHGSDVQGLQTTATFDPTKKCFVLNTPSIHAAKFWPGGLGRFCTHVVSQAKLIVNGKSHGLQTFVFKVRDTQTMKLLPGLEVGDIGPKLGFKGVDNGYGFFSNFEIPLDALLCKYIKVDENGSVVSTMDKENMRLMYGAMMTLRSKLVRMFCLITSKTHCAAHMHMSKIGYTPGHARWLLDRLAYHWNFVMTSRYCKYMFHDFSSNYTVNPKAAVKMIKEIHFLTSGLKVFSAYDMIQSAREQAVKNSIGNLVLAGFGPTYAEGVPGATYEGDGAVLIQQIMQVLLAYYNSLRNGKKITGAASFLNNFSTYAIEDKEFDKKLNILDHEDFIGKSNELLENYAFKFLQVSIKKLQKALMEDGVPMKVAFSDKLQIELMELGSHVFQIVIAKISSLIFMGQECQQTIAPEDMELLAGLLKLQEMNIVKECLGNMLHIGVIEENGKLSDLLEDAKEELYKLLVPKISYLAGAGFTKEAELSTLKNYKDIKLPTYEELKADVEKVTKGCLQKINQLSKL